MAHTTFFEISCTGSIYIIVLQHVTVLVLSYVTINDISVEFQERLDRTPHEILHLILLYNVQEQYMELLKSMLSSWER